MWTEISLLANICVNIHAIKDADEEIWRHSVDNTTHNATVFGLHGYINYKAYIMAQNRAGMSQPSSGAPFVTDIAGELYQ